jgi:hypothetical protein
MINRCPTTINVDGRLLRAISALVVTPYEAAILCSESPLRTLCDSSPRQLWGGEAGDGVTGDGSAGVTFSAKGTAGGFGAAGSVELLDGMDGMRKRCPTRTRLGLDIPL